MPTPNDSLQAEIPNEFGVTGTGELDLGLEPAPTRAHGRSGARPGLSGRPGYGPGVAPGSIVMPGLAPDAEPPPPAEGEASWETWVDLGWEPGDYGDPETDPDDFDTFLAGMPDEVRADFLAGPFTGDEGPIPAGFLHHERGGPTGVGFASGGVLDGMEPGPWLARALDAAIAGGAQSARRVGADRGAVRQPEDCIVGRRQRSRRRGDARQTAGRAVGHAGQFAPCGACQR